MNHNGSLSEGGASALGSIIASIAILAAILPARVRAAATSAAAEYMFVDTADLSNNALTGTFSLTTFALDSTGVATQVGSPVGNFCPFILVSNHGFLYAYNPGGSTTTCNNTTINEYKINSDGTLTSEGSITTPYPINGPGPAVALDDSGLFAYAVLFESNTTGVEAIEEYSVDPSTGKLTDIGELGAINPNPYTGNCAVGSNVFDTLLVDPELSTLYAEGAAACTVGEFSIDSSGALTSLGSISLPNSAYPGGVPFSSSIVPTDDALFVQSTEQVAPFDEQILPFAIDTNPADSTFGTLTAQPAVNVTPGLEGALAATSDGTALFTPIQVQTAQSCNLSGQYGPCSNSPLQSTTTSTDLKEFAIGTSASLSNVSTTPVETLTVTGSCPQVTGQDQTTLLCSFSGGTPPASPNIGLGPLFLDNSNSLLFYADPAGGSASSSLIEYQVGSPGLTRVSSLLPGLFSGQNFAIFSYPVIQFFTPVGEATLTPKPTSVIFKGKTAVGSVSKPQKVELEAEKSNTQSITIQGLTVAGTTNPKDFTLVLVGPQNNEVPCVGITLAPGQKCEFEVEFTPQEAGTLIGGATVTSNAVKYPTINVPLEGVAK